VAMDIVLRDDFPVFDTPLSQLTELFPDLNAVVVGIVRSNELFVPHGEDQMQIGDLVYVIAENTQTSRTLGLFGHEEKPPSRVLIAGGGNIGLYVARKLEERDMGTRVRLIDSSRERAESVAETLHRTVILHGSALDLELLREAGVSQSGAYIALTNDEKVNVLSAMLAKQEGAANAMALVSTLNVRPFATPLGIDSFIDPRSVTVSTILKHVRRGRIRGVHPVQNGEGEIVEAEALETSPVVGVPLRQAKLPEGVRLGAIVRGKTVVIPSGDAVIKPHDRVIVFALKDRIADLQHMFRVSLEYF
jgi:trk system potassium uptake protein